MQWVRPILYHPVSYFQTSDLVKHTRCIIIIKNLTRYEFIFDSPYPYTSTTIIQGKNNIGNQIRRHFHVWYFCSGRYRRTLLFCDKDVSVCLLVTLHVAPHSRLFCWCFFFIADYTSLNWILFFCIQVPPIFTYFKLSSSYPLQIGSHIYPSVRCSLYNSFYSITSCSLSSGIWFGVRACKSSRISEIILCMD